MPGAVGLLPGEDPVPGAVPTRLERVTCRGPVAQPGGECLEDVGVGCTGAGVFAYVAVVVVAGLEGGERGGVTGHAGEGGNQHCHGGVVGVGQQARRTAYPGGVVDLRRPGADRRHTDGG